MKLFVLISVSLHLITASKLLFELDKIETDDFKTLLRNGVLVDKTQLLVTGVLNPSNYGGSVITHRPEGWGKSTYMSMVEKFLQIEIDERGEAKIPKEITNNKLFLGGYIHLGSREVEKYKPLAICHYSKDVKFLGNLPVIFLKLKNVTGGSYQEIRDEMRARIWNLFEQHSYTDYGDAEYYKYWESDDYFIGSLYVLAHKLYNHFKNYRNLRREIITLIDDYDAPLINAYLEFGDKPREVEKVRQLLVNIYTAATEKNNMFRHTVVFTGVLDAVVSDSIHFKKDFHTPSHLNIHTDYAFLTHEIDQLANRSSNQVDAEQIKNWCCGTYDFFDRPLCQPRATMRYLAQNGKQTYYQSNSSIGRLVDKILSSEDIQFEIQSLIPINASIYHPVHSKTQPNPGIISLYPLDGISILYHCGYLRTQKSSSGQNHLTITTNETRYLFQTKVLQWIVKKFQIQRHQFQSFANLLAAGDLAQFKKTLEKYLCSAASYIQRGEKEAKMICDGLRIALYHTLSSTHHVKFIKQDVEEQDLGLVNEILSIPKFGSSNTSVIIKQKSDLKGTYLKSVTRTERFKGALESLDNDFYHERNIAFNIHSTGDKVNMNVLVQKFTSKMIKVRPEFNNTQFFMSFRLSNITDLCQYSLLKDKS